MVAGGAGGDPASRRLQLVAVDGGVEVAVGAVRARQLGVVTVVGAALGGAAQR